MNNSMYFTRRLCHQKRCAGIVILSCLLIFVFTAPVCAWPSIKVSPPSDLTASSISANSITLNWEDNSYNEDGFQIEISTADSGFDYLATVPADTTSYVCSGLNQNTLYWFRVQALGNAQILLNSDYSNVASATTLSIPKNQTNLKRRVI